MATLIKVDGTKTEVFPENKRKGFTLAEVYNLMNCRLVELVGPLDDGRSMLVDEEGKLKAEWMSRINSEATHLFRTRYGAHDVIVGDALLVTDKEFQ